MEYVNPSNNRHYHIDQAIFNNILQNTVYMQKFFWKSNQAMKIPSNNHVYHIDQAHQYPVKFSIWCCFGSPTKPKLISSNKNVYNIDQAIAHRYPAKHFLHAEVVLEVQQGRCNHPFEVRRSLSSQQQKLHCIHKCDLCQHRWLALGQTEKTKITILM